MVTIIFLVPVAQHSCDLLSSNVKASVSVNFKNNLATQPTKHEGKCEIVVSHA